MQMLLSSTNKGYLFIHSITSIVLIQSESLPGKSQTNFSSVWEWSPFDPQSSRLTAGLIGVHPEGLGSRPPDFGAGLHEILLYLNVQDFEMRTL